MIIRQVKLHPFGSVKNQKFNFTEGLNVLLGPNEAGKSTLVKAIFAVLFIPSDVRKNSRDWVELLDTYMPHPGGDTARVSIEFDTTQQPGWHFSCSWGSSKEERLLTPSGSEINDQKNIRAHLHEALQYGRATYEGILFARQEEMNSTLERLDKLPEATGTVAGLLRAALMESGGVSLEKLEEAIEKEYERLLNNWDFADDTPRGGRGINNPHKVKVGAVLSTYYEVEELRRNLKQVYEDEKLIVDLNRRMESDDHYLQELASRLQSYEQLEDDARLRNRLTPELQMIEQERVTLKNIVSEWPRVEERIKNTKKDIANRENNLKQLELELTEAEAVLKARARRTLLEKARPLQEEIMKKKKELAELPPIDRDELANIEKEKARQVRIKSVLEAMKLKAKIEARKPLQLKVTAGMEKLREFNVKDQEEIEGDGRLILESADWRIDIQSGQEDVEDLISQAEQTGRFCRDELARCRVENIEQAKEIVEKRDRLNEGVQGATAKLSGLMGDLSYEDLEKEVAALGDDRKVRAPETIRAEIEKKRADLNEPMFELKQEETKLKQWVEKYESLDQVTDKLVELKGEEKEKQEKLTSLKPRPEEYESDEQFIEALKQMRQKRDMLREKISSLKYELYEVQNRMPEQSTEDLQTELELREEELEKLKKEGRAINLVREEFEEMKKELDTDTYSPLVETFTRYLSLATGGRYGITELGSPLPEKIATEDGREMPVRLLSTGTVAGTALALRLAMARYLLNNMAGFVIMDDPMINLDPERRQSAAALIQEFASEKQLIVSTFDPETAAILGGNIVEM